MQDSNDKKQTNNKTIDYILGRFGSSSISRYFLKNKICQQFYSDVDEVFSEG